MASLLIVDGKGEGRHLPLTQPLTSVGRDDTCTFQIVDDQISRTHLQVKLDAPSGRHIAGDYRSANGVLVNGKKITLEVPLADGDRISIGATTLVYLAGDHADAEAAINAARQKGEWKRPTIMPRD